MQLAKPINEPVQSFQANSIEKKMLKEELAELSKTKSTIPLILDGKHVEKKSKEAIFSPHMKKTLIAEASTADAKDVETAIQSAVETQKEWSRMPLMERASVFLKAAEILSTQKYRSTINAATMLAQSKSCHQAEIDATCEMIDFLRFNAYFAQKILDSQPPRSSKGLWNKTEPRGLEGFVYAVGPFNFTSISVNLATAPALMGCCVVWKPATPALLASYKIYEILEKAGLPPGVINILSGDPVSISNEVFKNPNLAGIHFTGSTQTFETLWKNTAEHISHYKSYPRLVGETGGKDFIFAHNSADPDELIAGLIRGAFEYQGQKCSAASRAYIPKSLWKEIKEPLIEEIQGIKMGDPADFSNFVNAVIDERAYKKITSYIEHANKSSEAEILCGGEYDDTEGYFIRPTLVQTTNPQYKSMVEEIFGPVLTVFVYDDKDEEATLELCDTSTPYGLTGAIYCQDQFAATRLNEKLYYSAGNFYINDKPTGAVVGQQPFGGARKSGTNDKAGSEWNLARWTSMRTIKENFMPITDYRYDFLRES